MALEVSIRAGPIVREVVMCSLIFHVRLLGREFLLCQKACVWKSPKWSLPIITCLSGLSTAIPFFPSEQAFSRRLEIRLGS